MTFDSCLASHIRNKHTEASQKPDECEPETPVEGSFYPMEPAHQEEADSDSALSDRPLNFLDQPTNDAPIQEYPAVETPKETCCFCHARFSDKIE